MKIKKIFEELVYFFIEIGASNERRTTKIDHSKSAMIIFYYIQLIGYIYSQFESKSIKYYENDYLAQIGQYSSVPFLMIIIHYDPFTIIVYYCIFGTMLSIFIIVFAQLKFRRLSISHPLNRFIKFYFKNFQWYFLTPFDEPMIGVIACGPLSYLNQHSIIDPHICWNTISPHFLVISFLGMILVISSGFLCIYCFRNYEFIQGSLMRKYSYFNMATIILHMTLQISYFWRLMYDFHYNIIIHIVFSLIMIIILIDVYQDFPFGYLYESVFFIKSLLCSIYYNILISIWIFSNKDDGIIFLSFFMLAPLLFAIVEAKIESYINNKCVEYCQGKNKKINPQSLEFICFIAQQEQISSFDFFQLLQYLQIHCKHCQDIHCPCRQRIQKFISGSKIVNLKSLYLWTQYEFQRLVKQALCNQLKISNFEELMIKYVTFLQRFRDNEILSFKIISDLKYMLKKTNNNEQIPQFFQSLCTYIQNTIKQNLETKNKVESQLQSTEFNTLQEINLFYCHEQDLIKTLLQLIEIQKQLWNLKLNNQLNYDSIIYQSQCLQQQQQKINKMYNKLIQYDNYFFNESILQLRLKLIISLIGMDDLKIMIKIVKKLQNLEKEQSLITGNVFSNFQFINGSAFSIKSQISQGYLGIISQPINDQFKSFFNYQEDQILPTKVDELLPYRIGEIHTGLIDNFLQSGVSKRFYQNSEQFILNGYNIIEKVYVCLTMIYPLINGQNEFFILAHIQKIQKYETQLLDQNKKGYILVDSDFGIFGITKNIYERINYQYYYKQNKNANVQFAKQIYETYQIQDIIPNFSDILEDYYKDQQMQNKKRVNRQDTICQKQAGVLTIPKIKQMNYITTVSLSTKKYTNRHMIDVINSVSKLINSQHSIYSKQYPIEYTITQKLLTPHIDDTIQEFLYFVIEIDFLDEIKVPLQSQQIIAQTPQLSDLLRKQEQQQESQLPNQSNVVLSYEENQDQMEFIAVMTNTGTKRSQSELMDEIENIAYYMTITIPLVLKKIIGWLMTQSIFFLIIIIIISIIFDHKKNMQSNCNQQIINEIDFLQYYLQLMSATSQILYQRDFYLIINNTNINIDQEQIIISKEQKLIMLWQNQFNGGQQLVNIYNQYQQIVEYNNQFDNLELKIIGIETQTQISQIIQNYKIFQDILQEAFYVTFKSIPQQYDQYLINIVDNYTNQIRNSIILFNFVEFQEIDNQILQECQQQEQYINNYFDIQVIYIFIGIYIIIIIQLIGLIIYYLRITNIIQFYLKLFKLCDSEDCLISLQYCEKYSTIIQFDHILLRQSDFKLVAAQPENIFEGIQKQINKSTLTLVQKRKKKEQNVIQSNNSNIQSIIKILLSSLCLISYTLSFQIYYFYMTEGISPLIQRALTIQQMRLDFMISINSFNTYLIQEYYSSYISINQTDDRFSINSTNLYVDANIFNQLQLNKSYINNNINKLQSIDFTSVLFQSNTFSISNSDQNILLGDDICQLTGCDIQQDIYDNKYNTSIFQPFFQEGIMKLYQNYLDIIVQSNSLLELQNTDIDKALVIESILTSDTYIIYYIWGLDVTQFIVEQYTEYFNNQFQTIFNNLTDKNLILIIIIGFILINILISLQYIFIKNELNKFKNSLSILKYIPLPILFSKNIPKHLGNFQRKQKH